MIRMVLLATIPGLSVLFPSVCLAVDEGSSSHTAGQVFGAIFLIVIAFWTARRIMRKPSF